MWPFKKNLKKITEKVEQNIWVSYSDFIFYMKNNPTYSEYVFKTEYLDKRKEKFIFQKRIGRYIVDFYCPSLKLIIEVDGISHKYKGEYDKDRIDVFVRFGYKVLILQALDVLDSRADVFSLCNDVIAYLTALKKKKNKFKKNGLVFRESPLLFGTPEMLEDFTLGECKHLHGGKYF